MESTASTDDEEAVKAIFAESGIDVSIRVIIRKADVQLPWEVMVTAGSLGAGFLAAVGKNAGDDVYKQAKQLISRLWLSRGQHTGRDGHIVLRDDDFRVELLLQENLPVEAYQAIERIDRTKIERGDTLHYDTDENALGSLRPLIGRTHLTPPGLNLRRQQLGAGGQKETPSGLR